MNITAARLANKVMRTAICMLALALSIPLAAQTTQKGIVKEYNEKAQKTPLAGVELKISSANSTVSGKNGEFSLHFMTLKAGDHINVQNIKKEGYEIFNKDALEQWNLNPSTPFIVIMCKSDKFKKICDNYHSLASIHYKKQFKKDADNLNKLRDENKLREKEYSQELKKLQENYDQQLDNIDNYVDRLARIDLSESSEQIQNIINLINEGNFEDAIKKYDEIDLLNKFIEVCNQKNTISYAIKQLAEEDKIRYAQKHELLSEIEKQIDCLYYAGRFLYRDKILDLCKQVADLDELNFKFQLKTGQAYRDLFCDNKSAHIYFQRALSVAMDGVNKLDLAQCYELLGGTYSEQEKFDKALEYFWKSLEIIQMIYQNKTSLKEANCYNNIGTIYHKQGQYENALRNYKHALAIQVTMPNVESLVISRSYN